MTKMTMTNIDAMVVAVIYKNLREHTMFLKPSAFGGMASFPDRNAITCVKHIYGSSSIVILY